MITLEQTRAETRAATKTRRFYRPELDIVRFIAFGAVFLHHELPRDRNASVLSHISPIGGAIITSAANAFGFGLPLFFTLSAFLIGTLLLRETERYGTINLRAFYLRRVLRIWPLYFLGLIIGCIIAVFADKRPRDLMLFATFALMVGNWFSITWHTTNPMMLLWSISIEEQFYLFCPMTVKHFSRRGLYVFSFSLIALSDMTLYVLGQYHADTDRTIWYNSLVQFQMFGAGLLLCLLLHNRKISAPVWVRLPCLTAGFVCWLIACDVFRAKQVGPATSGAAMMAGYGVGAVGCLLIIVAMLDANKDWLPRPIIWLGRISFGLYVYHELSIWCVAGLYGNIHGYEHFILFSISGAGLTVLLAAVSYRYIETPFLRMKERFEVVPSRRI